MAQKIGYDVRMRSLDRAISKGFGVVAGLFLCAATAAAQINAAPPSVTSMGFGGRAINGTPPSVTSLGPRGYTPGYNPGFPNSRPFFNYGYGNHHHHLNGYAPLGATVYAVPIYGYAYGDPGDEADNAPPEDQYNGGPTIFDRRGPGAAAYVPPSAVSDSDNYGRAAGPADSDHEQMQAFAAPAAPDPAPTAQPQTVLVFKDGHEQEVENYAIVGDTLWDLTGDRRHKIALSDLNLDATVKANDDRGIDFTVPPGSM
jgi:hypothetical protein